MTTRATIDGQRAFYDERWQSFQFANHGKLARCIAILEAISFTGIHEPRIIDLGCGAGWLTGIAGHFGPTVGVDLSGLAIAQASVRYPYVQFIQEDIVHWAFPAAQYDIVISQEVIEHFEDQTTYLRVAHSLLRPGGYLVLTTPNKRTFYAMPDEQRLSWSNQPIENCLTISELRRLVSKYFEVVQVSTLIHGFGRKGVYHFVNSYRIRALIERLRLRKTYNSVLSALGFGLHTLVLARKTTA